jgi:hypothetical protein
MIHKIMLFIWDPAMIDFIALTAAIVWMLKDEKDRIRPVVVFALVFNLFFNILLTKIMGKEGEIFPQKYDYVLVNLDAALGISRAAIVRPWQGVVLAPVLMIYKMMMPVMFFWFAVVGDRFRRGALALAYVAELICGPLMYTIVPACGPLYAFHDNWVQPPPVSPSIISYIGIPNAFPSLHIGSALILVFLAPNKLWRSVALTFFAATAYVTLATGEHYVIDLIAGLAFGCFATAVGFRRVRKALVLFGCSLCWSFSVRFGYTFLLAHARLVQLLSLATILLTITLVAQEWRAPARSAVEDSDEPGEAKAMLEPEGSLARS